MRSGEHSKDEYPITQYNSLTDPNLQGYFSKTTVRSHLLKAGLINKRGSIIPDAIYKYKVAQKEQKRIYRQMLATAIVQEALDIERQRQAKIRDEMETIAKIELVRRMRGMSAHHEIPSLWPSNRLPALRQPSAPPIESKRILSFEKKSERIFGTQLEETFDKYLPRPPDQKKNPARRFNRKMFAKSNKISNSTSPKKRSPSTKTKPKPGPCIVTMCYHGKGLNLPCDHYVFDAVDQITVLQQHCGGENLIVFKGKVEENGTFSFESKRHKEFPFSLSIYINGSIDCRISTCCEYRHKLNARIGGKKGKFTFVSVTDGKPCYKCLLDRKLTANKLKSIKQSDTNTDDAKSDDETRELDIHYRESNINQRIEQNEQDEINKQNKLEIPITHEEDFIQKELYDFEFEQEESDAEIQLKPGNESTNRRQLKKQDSSVKPSNCESTKAIDMNENLEMAEANKNRSSNDEIDSDSSSYSNGIISSNDATYNWILKFHTKDRQRATNKSVDEAINFEIIGDQGESRPVKLRNKHGKLFQPGQIDSFDIKTRNIGVPKYIIVSLNGALPWYLDKVELFDKNTRDIYVFSHNQWISNSKFAIITLNKNDNNTTNDNTSEDETSDVSSAVVKESLHAEALTEISEASNNHQIQAQTRWSISIFTSKLSSNVEANIFVKLLGSKSNSSKQLIFDKNENEQLFYPGSLQKFDISSNDIGQLLKLQIGYDVDSKAEIDWYIDRIELENIETRDWYYFEVKDRLSNKRNDAKTELDLEFSQHGIKPRKTSVIKEEEEEEILDDFRDSSSERNYKTKLENEKKRRDKKKQPKKNVDNSTRRTDDSEDTNSTTSTVKKDRKNSTSSISSHSETSSSISSDESISKTKIIKSPELVRSEESANNVPDSNTKRENEDKDNKNLDTENNVTNENSKIFDLETNIVPKTDSNFTGNVFIENILNANPNAENMQVFQDEKSDDAPETNNKNTIN